MSGKVRLLRRGVDGRRRARGNPPTAARRVTGRPVLHRPEAEQVPPEAAPRGRWLARGVLREVPYLRVARRTAASGASPPERQWSRQQAREPRVALSELPFPDAELGRQRESAGGLSSSY